MSTYNYLQLQHGEYGEVTLWLNRPERHNAFDAEMIAELISALAALQGDGKVRLLLLRGRGKHFCSGADLAWMQASASLSYEANLADARQLGELMQRLHNLPFPTLAVVQGAAFGGALGLVSCCDMAIGSDDALFSLSEVRIGLVPAVISPYVVQAIGPRATRRYALSAARFNGHTAQALGLLAECYAAEALDEAVHDWVRQLLDNSPEALKATKALLRDVGDGELTSALREQTETVIASIRCSAEGQEGLHAFLEKRKPRWQEPS